MKKISNLYSRGKKKSSHFFKNGFIKKSYSRTVLLTRRRPVISLIGALLLLLLTIAAGNYITTQNQPEQENIITPKNVRVYQIGDTPTVRLQARIEKNGVIKITALTGGVVSSIPVTEGQVVQQGQSLINMSSNYSGASAPGLQTQLAHTQYNNVLQTYDTQKEIVEKQREIAETTEVNAEELRDINASSLGDTRSLLDTNEDLLDIVNEQLDTLEDNNADPQAILQTRQAQAQLQSGINQLRSTVRTLEYQTDDENPPADLSEMQRDLTLKQLNIQEKSLDLNREVSRLQYQIAAVSESLLHPSAPFNAIVERIHVQVGQSVSPGTVLVTISCLDIKSTAVINTPRKFALSLSQVEPSMLLVGNSQIPVYPTYISTVATEGQLYSVMYDIPAESQNSLTDEGYIPIDVPIGFSDTSGAVPFLPIDAVYQTQDSAYVNVVNGDTVESKNIVLGSVYGKYVEVTSGLTSGDMVILDRTVVSGDRIEIIRDTASIQ